MTVYARQIKPEYQESPLYVFVEYPEKLIVYGNKQLKGCTIPAFDSFMHDWDNAAWHVSKVMEGDKTYFDTVTEVIEYYFPPIHKDGYSSRDVYRWKQVLQDMESDCNDSYAICKALDLMTGDPYNCTEIHGSCQGDWQDVYYPVKLYNKKFIQNFEIEYFNLGSEWMIHDEDTEVTEAADVSGYSMYCYSWDDDGIKQEIADSVGCKPEEVKLFKYMGESHYSTYSEAV